MEKVKEETRTDEIISGEGKVCLHSTFRKGLSLEAFGRAHFFQIALYILQVIPLKKE